MFVKSGSAMCTKSVTGATRTSIREAVGFEVSDGDADPPLGRLFVLIRRLEVAGRMHVWVVGLLD